MIGRREFLTGLLASAAMPMLVGEHRVVLVGMDFGRPPAMVAGFNEFILVGRSFKELFDQEVDRLAMASAISLRI